jgi:YNFM family putative membrane transporter
VVGWAAGVVWAWAGWTGVVTMLGAVLLVAMAVALRLRGLAPLEPLEPHEPQGSVEAG